MSTVKVMKQLSMAQLRSILAEQIEQIRDGQATASGVNAISNASGKILASIKLELEYYKLIGKTPDMPALLGAHEEDEEPRTLTGFEKKKTG